MFLNNWHRIELSQHQINSGFLDQMLAIFKDSKFLSDNETAVFRDITISDRFILYFPPNVWHYCNNTLNNVPDIKYDAPDANNLEVYQGVADAKEFLIKSQRL